MFCHILGKLNDDDDSYVLVMESNPNK